MKTSHWHGGVKVTARSISGGGLVGALVALLVVVLAGGALYSVADAVLLGVRDSAAEANRVVAYTLAALVAAGAVTGTWWLVSARPAALARDETARQHALAVSTDVAARQIERATARHLEQERQAALERAGRPAPSPISAAALPWDREPIELDRRWSR